MKSSFNFAANSADKNIWLYKPAIVASACTLSLALALLAQLTGASLRSSWLILALIPTISLLVYILRKLLGLARRLDLFSPLVAFPILYVAWFAVGSVDLIHVPARVSFGLFEPVPAYVLGYAALGLLAYSGGAVLARSESLVRPRSSQEFAWIEDRFWAAMIGLTALMLASYAFIIAGIGGVPAFSADAGDIRLGIAKYGPVEAVLFTCAWTLIPAFMLYVWQRRPKVSIRFSCYAVVALSSLLLLSLGGRSYLFVPFVTTLVARHYGKQRFAIKKLALVGILLFCTLSFFGYVRDTSLNGDDFGNDKFGIPGTIVPFVYSYLYVRYPVATFRDITEIIPRKLPYQNGALTFGPLATFLPGHHDQSDIFFKDILGNDFIGGGQPATLLGPLYADAGLLGIVLGLFLFGMLISHTYCWMLANPTAIRVLLFAWLTQTLLFSLFANLFPYLTTLWIPGFWMVLHIFLRKSRLSDTAPGITGRLSPAH